MKNNIDHNITIEVDAVGIALKTDEGTAIYLDELGLKRLFVFAVRHRLIDAQQIMSEVYDC